MEHRQRLRIHRETGMSPEQVQDAVERYREAEASKGPETQIPVDVINTPEEKIGVVVVGAEAKKDL